MGFRAGDRLLAAVPFSHSYGFTTLALSALVRGLTADRAPGHDAVRSARRGGALRRDHRADGAGLFAGAAGDERAPPWAATVRLVVSAGATLPPAVASQFRRTYGQAIHTFYGSSECGGICYDRTGEAAERGTVGTPVRDVRLSFTPLAGEPDYRRARHRAVAGGVRRLSADARRPLAAPGASRPPTSARCATASWRCSAGPTARSTCAA